MKRVVSLTPLPVQRDSRTLKLASSIASFGYESVVVEDQPSRVDREDLAFELVSPGGDGASAGPAGSSPDGDAPDVHAGRWKRFQQGYRDRRAGLVGALPGPLPDLLRSVARAVGWIPRYLVRYGPLTSRRLPEADLYYLHATRQYPAVWIKSRLRRIPYVYDAHDFYPASWDEDTEQARRDRLIGRFLVGVERSCVRRAAEVVTVSPGVADLIEDKYGRRPLIVRNCHDTRLDRPVEADIRERLGIDDQDFLLVVVGNAKEGRAIEEAIEAVGRLPKTVHLALLGGRYAPFRAAIEEKGLADRVHLIDPVAPTEVVPFIASADAAAVIYFPFSVDYLHALPNGFFSPIAAGLPLLYPETLPDLSAIAGDHGLGLAIDPRDPSSFAEGLRSLVEDRALREKLAANVRGARDELSWVREEERVAELLSRTTPLDSAPQDRSLAVG